MTRQADPIEALAANLVEDFSEHDPTKAERSKADQIELVANSIRQVLNLEAIADALVADLFRNGSGLEGERLAIMAGGIDHGGWSRVGFRDRVLGILRTAPAGKSKIDRIVDAAREETERGRQARRQP